MTECNTKVRIPWQEWVHQEKCLFTDDGNLSNSPEPSFRSSELDNHLRNGRGSVRNSFHHREQQHHNHHYDEYGSAKDPEAFDSEPNLDHELEPDFVVGLEPDLDVRSGRNIRHNHQPLGIINERVEYDPRRV